MVCHLVHHMYCQEFLRALFWVPFFSYSTSMTSTESRLVLYADDILLFHPIRTIGDYSALQADIDALSNWATQNTMTFNTAKCKYMRISRKKKCIISAPSFFLNGCPLEDVPTFKYLGIIISSDLSWSQHTEGICSKAMKIIGMLYRRYYQYADSSTLRSYGKNIFHKICDSYFCTYEL